MAAEDGEERLDIPGAAAPTAVERTSSWADPTPRRRFSTRWYQSSSSTASGKARSRIQRMGRAPSETKRMRRAS
jgi:hypothetical protein